MTSAVIGWDIGGANVKAVCLDADGMVLAAMQRPCALWKGLQHLEMAIADVMAHFQCQPQSVAHVVTMTGELVDLFEHRAQGVQAIAACLQQYFPHARFYAADAHGVRLVSTVTAHTAAIASMNWHASAYCLSQDAATDILLLDIGSTTTDVTCCRQRQVAENGWSDAARMRRGSLLYTGVVRTPLMAFGPVIEWQGRAQGVAAEYFATMADVYRVTGQLPAEHDMEETADGRDKSMLSSLRRLARMVGHDVEDMPQAAWLALAQAYAMAQLNLIETACRRLLDQNTSPQLVGLGAGAFLVDRLAERLGLNARPAKAFIRARNETLRTMAVVCFPAYAVARVSQTCL